MSETATMTLTEFLLARIAEDEADRVTRFREGRLPTPRELREADRWQAECEAKRRIVERCKFAEEHPDWAGDMEIAGHWDDAMDTLLDLASIHADHPNYRDEWRP